MPVCVDLLLLPKNAYCAHRRRENYNCSPVTPRQPPTLEFASWHLRNTSSPDCGKRKNIQPHALTGTDGTEEIDCTGDSIEPDEFTIWCTFWQYEDLYRRLRAHYARGIMVVYQRKYRF